MLELLKPEYVTPGVVFLASDEAPNGVILTAGAGVFSAAQMIETGGVDRGRGANADLIAANWQRITDFTGAKHYVTGTEQVAKILERVQQEV
jgi:hypothetical protein